MDTPDRAHDIAPETVSRRAALKAIGAGIGTLSVWP